MIVKMRKYSFLIYHGDYEKFLEEIRDIGVFHVEEKETAFDDETLEQKYVLKKQLNDTRRFLTSKEPSEMKTEDVKDGIELVKRVNELKIQKDKAEQELALLEKEKKLIEPWGEFSHDSIEKLKDANLKADFFICSSKRFNPEWENEFFVFKINEVSGNLYFVVLSQPGDEVILEAEKAKLPHRSLSEILNGIEKVTREIDEIDNRLKELASQIALIDQAEAKIDFDLNHQKVVLSTRKEAENKLMVLEGYVPVPNEDDLVNYLENSYVYYSGEDVDPDDKNVPVLLKNNRYSRLFEPIGKLFSLPSYKELDLTPFFAPFFTLFFGFCLGDAGYGVLILLGTTIYKAKWAKPDIKPILSLAQWLGLATIIMGTISGTLFGIDLINADWISFNDLFMSPLQLFYFSLVLGLIQILFGMILRAANYIKQRGFVYGLSTIGWILLILTMLFFEGGSSYDLIDKERFNLVYNILLIGSGALIVFFNNPDVNIFARVGGAIWNGYNVVTGVFGDLLSYIRLFALGISSAILGFVFNDIASEFLSIKYFGWIPFVLLLVFGHGINLFLASLSGFIHPMRLIFVEFYKNADFKGGGKEYKPFKK